MFNHFAIKQNYFHKCIFLINNLASLCNSLICETMTMTWGVDINKVRKMHP